MEITSLKVKEINKVKITHSLNAPILKMNIKLDKNTLVPNNNNLIIYVKQGTNIKEFTFALTNPLGYLKNISDEFVISPSFNGEKVELSTFVNRNVGTTKTKEDLVYKPIVLFEGDNEIYTNYENAIIEVSYPKDTEMLYYFLSNVMSTRNTGETNAFDIDMIYPVGSVYISVEDTNPQTLFGGSWESFATGRTLVGVDTTQTEFNTANKTGGEKTHILTINEIPSHTHNSGSTIGSGVSNGSSTNYLNSLRNTHEGNPSGGGQAHNNLPPYITVFMWRRIA